MPYPLKENCSINGRDYKAAVYWLDKLVYFTLNENSDPETFTDAVNLGKRLGVTPDRLDQLSIIHVGGSKGKGSVCAMCENILRGSGFKTGFLSSPHLVEFRERIRIDGKPLAKEKFAKYFFELYDLLRLDEYDEGVTENGTKSPQNGEGGMSHEGSENGGQGIYIGREGIEDGEEGPKSREDVTVNSQKYDGYISVYQFLTMMAYHVFIEEKVDVGIIEVGLGGRYDSTNIHRSPTVVGISLLDYDHMNILGKTIDLIAYAKAGICKPGRPCFTIEQPENGLAALQKGAEAQNASSIMLCPPITSYDFKGQPIQIGIVGNHQKVNASLALQLCKTWMEEMAIRDDFQLVPNKSNQPPMSNLEITRNGSSSTVSMAQPFVLPDSFIKGLKTCYWPGRTQVVKQDRLTFYIDGAHTPSSVKACLPWFDGAAKTEAEAINGTVARVLIFNVRGDRDYVTLLEPFMTYNFDGVIFCPSVQTAKNNGVPDDLYYISVDYEAQLVKCRNIESTFTMLLNQRSNTSERHTKPKVMVLSCVQEAFEWVARSTKTAEHAQVLVTGSLYLVGTALAIIDPKLALEY